MDDRADRGHLSEQDAGAGDGDARQLFHRGQRLVGGQRPHPLQRLKADGPHHDQFAGHRLEQQSGLTDDLVQFRFDTSRADEFLQILQPRAALTAEDDRIGFADTETVYYGMGALAPLARATVVAGRRPVVVVDRHVQKRFSCARSSASRSQGEPWSTDMGAISFDVVGCGPRRWRQVEGRWVNVMWLACGADPARSRIMW